MADILEPARRSALMAKIRGADTRPEFAVAAALAQAGVAFHRHARWLPGTPDFAVESHRAAIFVNGCFWHGHGCAEFKAPGSNQAYWQPKLAATRLRDQRALGRLADLGWRSLTVWECALRRRRHAVPELAELLADWLQSGPSPAAVELRSPRLVAVTLDLP